MRIANLKAFQIPKIDLTGMGTWIIQSTGKKAGRHTMKQRWTWTMAVRIQNLQSSEM
jgi:hypothetical protein